MPLNANDAASWQDREFIVDMLSTQLVRGRLALILGAGVSQPFGLPNWDALVNNMSEKVGEMKMPPDGDPILRASNIRNKYYPGQRKDFCNLVKDSLYKDFDLNFAALRSSEMLSAIGALAMASKRGSASTIVTFNFDDILERYLEYHGFSTNSVTASSHWASNNDITIYHPHGFLPSDDQKKLSSDVVLGSDEFWEIMSASDHNPWRNHLLAILSTHTCLFLGISGKDMHLHSLAQAVKKSHAVNRERMCRHSVLLTKSGSMDPELDGVLNGWGIAPFSLNEYSDIPHLLFEICQRASKK